MNEKREAIGGRNRKMRPGITVFGDLWLYLWKVCTDSGLSAGLS